MAWLSSNVALLARREHGAWRSLSLAAWKTPSEASVYAQLELDAEPMLAFLRRASEQSGVPTAMVHGVGRAVAEVLRRFPDANCLLRWGRLYRRRDVDLFFPVAMDSQGDELSGVVLRGVDRMTLSDVAVALSREAVRARRSRRIAWTAQVPGFLARTCSRLAMRAGGFVLYTLNLWSPAFGLPRDGFGSAAVSDLSRFGAKLAFPPLLPIARLPLLVGIGPIVEGGAWRDGRWVPRKQLSLSIVFDHRVLDGVYAGRMNRCLERIFANPEEHLGAADAS